MTDEQPPQQDSHATPDAEGAKQPPWVIPVVVGIVAVAAIVLALIFTRDSGDDTVVSDTTAEAVDTTPEVPTTIEPATTEAPSVTEPPATTIAPETTAPPATEPPATDAPSTTTPAEPSPDEPTAARMDQLGADEASIASSAGEKRFRVASTCTATVTIGFQVQSSVLVGPDDEIFVVDVQQDEGSDAFLVITDMTQEIAGFVYGQDTASSTRRWAESFVGLSTEIEQVSAQPLEGTSEVISFSMRNSGAAQCGSGFTATPSPILVGTQITPVGQFDGDIPGEGFAVLAECDGSYLLTNGGQLSLFEFDGGFSASIAPSLDSDGFYFTPDDLGTIDEFIEQQGAGGDITYAARMTNFDGADAYFTVTVQPTVAGGLAVAPCQA